MLRGRLFPCDLAIRGLAISFLTLARVPYRPAAVCLDSPATILRRFIE